MPCLSLKGFSAIEIYINLMEILPIEATVYSIMTRYFHTISFTNPIEVEENQDRRSSFSENDEVILEAFANEPFSFLPDLARHAYLSKTIIRLYPKGSLGFTIRYLLWVPYRYQTLKKQIRMIYQNNYLVYLKISKPEHDMLSLP
jgi:hypothetical protein